MLDNKVTKPGALLFHNGKVYVEGWELEKPGMCREHVIFACLYVAAELMKSAHAGIEGAEDRNTCADLPTEVAVALGFWPPAPFDEDA
jgi:hypothetical protein